MESQWVACPSVHSVKEVASPACYFILLVFHRCGITHRGVFRGCGQFGEKCTGQGSEVRVVRNTAMRGCPTQPTGAHLR